MFYIYFVVQSTLKMEQKNYLQDIHEIKNMMNRSSQFISLSGLSGVLAGIYALVGAYIAKRYLPTDEVAYAAMEKDSLNALLYTALGVLAASITSAIILTNFKAQKENESVWNSTSKRMLVNFLIPLVTGGIFAILLLREHSYHLIAPVTMLFYGLACVNASKYTLRDIRYLGITMVLLGLICVAFPGYGVEFWALGFGVCHIIYGSIMYFKYDRK